MKKFLLFMSLQLALLPFLNSPLKDAEAVKTTGQLNNIVLFAQYENPEEHNFMADYTDKIIDLCNSKDNKHSLNSYINQISYNQLNVTSYFPQMKDGVIVPYKLSQAKSDYTNCQQYAIEMIQNIAVSEDINPDADSDGVVDNIILIVEGTAENTDSPTWSKAFTSPGIKINGVEVGTVNIHNSHNLFENIISGGEGVLCHEFLHSIGYPDLYRSGRTGVPVGMWDIMASNSIFLQYPLAYQRATVSGWLDYSEITKSGKYSLVPASEENGNRLYILKTPLSDTEFFAVEYRRQGAKYSDELDAKIYGSGLCVYRINTEENGNFKGGSDQIYIFRPDETFLDAGEGDLKKSCYGGENAPDYIGSLDWNDGISDGAIVYSNGTNSGIRISDIVMNENELTFNIEFADSSEADFWSAFDTSTIKNTIPYQTAKSPDGNINILTSDHSDISIYRIEKNALVSYGEKIKSTGGIYNPEFTFCGEVPYVLYHDKNYFIHILKLESSGKWKEIYSSSELVQYADITSDNEKVYFAYTVGSFPFKLTASSYDPETEKISDFGFADNENVCNISAVVCDGKLIIGYRSITDENKPKIAIYPTNKSGGNWNIYAVSDTECGAVSVAADGDIAVISPCGKNCSPYLYKNGQLSEMPLPDNINKNAFMQYPVVSGKEIFLAVNAQNPDVMAVYKYNDTKWDMLGDVLANEVVNEFSIAESGGNLYCSYFTSNGTPVIKYIESGTEKIKGDVNSDGLFNIADVVIMQNFILGNGNITDWQAGDLCEDNRIDVFDMIMMRKKLTVI